MPLASAHSNSFTQGQIKSRSCAPPTNGRCPLAQGSPASLAAGVANGSVPLEEKTVGASLGECSQLTFTKSSCPSAYRTRIRISCLDGGPRPAFGLLTLRIVPGLVCRLTVWDRPQPLRPLLLSCYGPVRVPASFLQLRTSTGTR